MKLTKQTLLPFSMFLSLLAQAAFPAATPADDDDEKLPEINRFISRYPESWEGYYRAADYYEREDVRDIALQNFAKAIELNPKNGELYLGRAEMNLMTTRTDKAIADTDAAIKMFPKWPAAYMKRARAESSVEDYASARNDLEKALSLLPNDDDALDQLAYAYDGLGKHEKAIETATKAILMTDATSRGGQYYPLQNRAFFWAHAHQYQRAYQDISLSVMAKPKNSQAWAYFAYALAMDGKMAKAKEAMQICKALDTFAPRAMRLKAEMHRAGGEWEEALADYKTSTRLEPGYGPGWTQRAITEIALGDYTNAIADLNKALEKVPKSVLTYCYLALAEDQSGKDAEAKTHIDKAISLDPEFALSYVMRARINMNHADYSMVADDCQKALKLDPFLGDAYAAASTALANCGKPDEAKKFMDQAAAMGWKKMEKDLQSRPAPSGTTIEISVPVRPDLAVLVAETEKNIGECAP